MSEDLLEASSQLESNGFKSRRTGKQARSLAIGLDILVLIGLVIVGITISDPQIALALLAGPILEIGSSSAGSWLPLAYPLIPIPFLGAIAAIVYLPALYLAGTYETSALLDPSRCVVRILMLWMVCLAGILGIVGGTEITSMPSLLRPVDAAFPIAVLISRGLVSVHVSWCGYAGRLRAENMLFVVDRLSAAPCHLTALSDPQSIFQIPSFSEVPKSTLEQLIAMATNTHRNEIVLLQGAASISACWALTKVLRATDLRVELLTPTLQPEMNELLVRTSASGYHYELQRAPINETGLRMKRAMDLWGAIALCIIMAPLLLSIAVAVKLTSKGPVLYAQTRTGRNGHTFTILKFRTMVFDANGAGVIQAVRGDKRITSLGRWLRFTSFDELPQLLNVIKGDMSLIGPRPHAVAHDRMFAAKYSDYDMRFRVRPGISGLAQVCGFRGETSTDDAILSRITLDLRYIKDWSFRGDLYILFRTVRAVIMPQNAY